MTARPWPRWPAFAGPDGVLLELNELMEARYRHHLAYPEIFASSA